MKRQLATLLLASTVTLLAGAAHADPAQTAPQGLTREQVRADLYKSFLNGTTAADEKTSYPSPASDRAELSAQRIKEAHVNSAYANFVQ
ncbi:MULTISPECIES: DUF4148 domain-containing protein [Paraburkholderia]|jgi:hypothetical protein|uniref:DUF4148 domain-containing protein n=1 Tax=Paraburkholderia phenazinium TaxID=60549 RepID=A0A1N6GEN2_9BURK|nr:DUF4148 domain-containing protein [Paraburkholderia phenazinium]SIO06039.1 protein of unknown function [Paraburkholderia phenazinium]